METREELTQRVRREQQLAARLRLATMRLADAELERVWAIVAAHEGGLSIRKIAAATDLSASRIHQLLQADEAREIPTWLSHLRDPERVDVSSPSAGRPLSPLPIQVFLADELEVLRWCLDWLERLEHGNEVVVNLRPATEEETEFVPFDRPACCGSSRGLLRTSTSSPVARLRLRRRRQTGRKTHVPGIASGSRSPRRHLDA